MKIQVGVYNIPYGDENITTAEVAAILEKRYGLMAELARRSLPILSKEITKKTIQKLYGNVSGDDNLHETQDYMRHLIKSKAFDGNLKGVPTDASLAGKRSKFKKAKQTSLNVNTLQLM